MSAETLGLWDNQERRLLGTKRDLVSSEPRLAPERASDVDAFSSVFRHTRSNTCLNHLVDGRERETTVPGEAAVAFTRSNDCSF